MPAGIAPCRGRSGRECGARRNNRDRARPAARKVCARDQARREAVERRFFPVAEMRRVRGRKICRRPSRSPLGNAVVRTPFPLSSADAATLESRPFGDNPCFGGQLRLANSKPLETPYNLESCDKKG